MKNLVIVESPSKSKTIEKYLGKDFKVVSSKGHICELATRGKEGLGVDVEHDFKPTYVVSPDKKDVVAELKKQACKAENVYLATDPDREGEAIAWHLARELGLDVDADNRIVFNEITKDAVLEALKRPHEIDMALVRSQETRRILDRIIGFKLSKLLQRKIGSKSAGRVQSIALRMICDREKEIEAFVPEEYWKIDAALKPKMTVELTRHGNDPIKIANEQEADAILSELGKEFVLEDMAEKTKKRAAFLPFTTSTMQQEASTKLGFGSRKTMMVAQSLYEGVEIGGGAQGLITYMRTDSTRLSNEFVSSAYSLIERRYGKQYRGFYRVKNNEQSQDAHEAIRPTSLDNDPEAIRQYLTNDQYRLYKFIYIRALASLMAEAVFKSVTYVFDNNGYKFTITGSKQDFDGFLQVYGEYDRSKDVILPKLEIGNVLKATSIDKHQHFTEAPSRYTEAKLIKALEEEGVGRPSTYAMIIDTNIKRNYVEYKKASESGKTKYFYPTKQGMITDQKLREFFLSVINIKYTAEMETKLDKIAENKLDSVAELKRFYDEFEPLVESAYDKIEKLPPEKTGEKCPQCGGDVVIRKGRFGEFKSCNNYPSCKWTAPMNEKEAPEQLDRNCPKCGKPLLKRKSRYGNYFIGCSGYPDCDYLESIPGQSSGRFRRRKAK